MKQYLQLLRDIKSQGTLKPAAREGMPGTLSLFGYQYKHDLASGFPLLTTKKMPFKWIVTELMWFLRGDTNIKYLDERGVTGMWHEDAYNYYVKIYNQRVKEGYQYSDELLTFEGFCQCVKYGKECATDILKPVGYEWGDCGEQYGHLWRRFFRFKI